MGFFCMPSIPVFAGVPQRISVNAELVLQRLVDGLRVRFAPGLLHHLTDEPADHLRFPCDIGRLVRIGSDHLVDHGFYRTGIAHLLKAALLDDLRRIAAFPDHDRKHVLRDLARNRSVRDEIDDTANLLLADIKLRKRRAGSIGMGRQVASEPVRDKLGVPPPATASK